jgi:hypothetical protein
MKMVSHIESPLTMTFFHNITRNTMQPIPMAVQALEQFDIIFLKKKRVMMLPNGLPTFA